MKPQVHCIQTIGIRPTLVQIEVSSHFQVPQLVIIGLPSTEIEESKERVRSAILNSGLEFPNRRVIVNLSPAFLQKSGTGMDLAIALGILIEHSGSPIPFQKILAWGELSLSGKVKRTPHSLHALFLACQRDEIDCLVLPESISIPEDYLDALKLSYRSRKKPLAIILLESLQDVLEKLTRPAPTLNDSHVFPCIQTQRQSAVETLSLPHAKLSRILGCTLAGEHHLLMLGPKGVGKSHSIEILARSFHNSDPSRVIDRALTSDLYSQTSEVLSPVRFVGVQVKPQALQGSFRGTKFKPGECSLAHGGLLICDEFPEWSRDSKECLRHPLERGTMPVNRVEGSFEAPARFQFIGSGNLCPCGGSPWTNPPTCICKLPDRERYRAKLSGPVLDRIDFFVLVSKFQPDSTTTNTHFREKIETVKKRLLSAHGSLPSHWSSERIEHSIRKSLTPSIQIELEKIQSLRSQHKVIRTAHTLAAWDGSTLPQESHILEAIQLRPEQWV